MGVGPRHNKVRSRRTSPTCMTTSKTLVFASLLLPCTFFAIRWRALAVQMYIHTCRLECSCQGKSCQPFQAVVCVEWQQRQIRELKPVAMCLDATGQLNRYGYPLFTLLTYDNFGMYSAHIFHRARCYVTCANRVCCVETRHRTLDVCANGGTFQVRGFLWRRLSPAPPRQWTLSNSCK